MCVSIYSLNWLSTRVWNIGSIFCSLVKLQNRPQWIFKGIVGINMIDQEFINNVDNRAHYVDGLLGLDWCLLKMKKQEKIIMTSSFCYCPHIILCDREGTPSTRM